MYVRMYVCMYVCMYVYIYIYMYSIGIRVFRLSPTTRGTLSAALRLGSFSIRSGIWVYIGLGLRIQGVRALKLSGVRGTGLSRDSQVSEFGIAEAWVRDCG